MSVNLLEEQVIRIEEDELNAACQSSQDSFELNVLQESDDLKSLLDNNVGDEEAHSLLGSVHKLPDSPENAAALSVKVSNLFTPDKQMASQQASQREATTFTTLPIHMRPNLPSVTPEKGDIMTAQSSSSSSYVPPHHKNNHVYQIPGGRARGAFLNVRTQRPSLDESEASPQYSSPFAHLGAAKQANDADSPGRRQRAYTTTNDEPLGSLINLKSTIRFAPESDSSCSITIRQNNNNTLLGGGGMGEQNAKDQIGNAPCVTSGFIDKDTLMLHDGGFTLEKSEMQMSPETAKITQGEQQVHREAAGPDGCSLSKFQQQTNQANNLGTCEGSTCGSSNQKSKMEPVHLSLIGDKQEELTTQKTPQNLPQQPSSVSQMAKNFEKRTQIHARLPEKERAPAVKKISFSPDCFSNLRPRFSNQHNAVGSLGLDFQKSVISGGVIGPNKQEAISKTDHFDLGENHNVALLQLQAQNAHETRSMPNSAKKETRGPQHHQYHTFKNQSSFQPPDVHINLQRSRAGTELKPPQNSNNVQQIGDESPQSKFIGQNPAFWFQPQPKLNGYPNTKSSDPILAQSPPNYAQSQPRIDEKSANLKDFTEALVLEKKDSVKSSPAKTTGEGLKENLESPVGQNETSISHCPCCPFYQKVFSAKESSQLVQQLALQHNKSMPVSMTSPRAHDTVKVVEFASQSNINVLSKPLGGLSSIVPSGDQKPDNELFKITLKPQEAWPFIETGRLQKTFILDKKLGEGAFGQVYMVRHKLDGQIYALKQISIHLDMEQAAQIKSSSTQQHDVNSDENKKAKMALRALRGPSATSIDPVERALITHPAMKEIGAISRLSHTNIVGYKGCWVEAREPDTSTINLILKKQQTKQRKLKKLGIGLGINEGIDECSSDDSARQRELSLQADLQEDQYYEKQQLLSASSSAHTSSNSSQFASSDSDGINFSANSEDLSQDQKIRKRKQKIRRSDVDSNSSQSKDSNKGSESEEDSDFEDSDVYSRCASDTSLYNLVERQATFAFLSVNILMEYAEGCTLRDTLEQIGSKGLDRGIIYSFFGQLMSGLRYIHSKGLIHRDIKPENIFVNPNSGHLKLGDFGLAKRVINSESTKQNRVLLKHAISAVDLDKTNIFGQITGHGHHNPIQTPALASNKNSLKQLQSPTLVQARHSSILLQKPSLTSVTGTSGPDAAKTSANTSKASKGSEASDKKAFDSEMSEGGIGGTRMYLSPEMIEITKKLQQGKPEELKVKRAHLLKKVPLEKVDIYAAGLVLFEMCGNFTTAMERCCALEDLTKKRVFPRGFTDKFYQESQIITLMTEVVPQKRPSADLLIKSPQFQCWDFDLKCSKHSLFPKKI